jgi:hypothetical protein
MTRRMVLQGVFHGLLLLVVGMLVFHQAAAYAFAVVFAVGPAVGARGLEAAGPPLHLVIFGVLGVALVLLLLAMFVLLWDSCAALRVSDPE